MLQDTVSLTVLRAGYKVNVIPESAEAEIDCRLLPDTDAGEFLDWIRGRVADDRVEIESAQSFPRTESSPLTGEFVDAVGEGIRHLYPGAPVFPMMVPGATDGRYWRQRGYPAYGLAPVVMERGDLGRVHGIDERISGRGLLEGIRIASEIIRNLCADQVRTGGPGASRGDPKA